MSKLWQRVINYGKAKKIVFTIIMFFFYATRTLYIFLLILKKYRIACLGTLLCLKIGSGWDRTYTQTNKQTEITTIYVYICFSSIRRLGFLEGDKKTDLPPSAFLKISRHAQIKSPGAKGILKFSKMIFFWEV